MVFEGDSPVLRGETRREGGGEGRPRQGEEVFRCRTALLGRVFGARLKRESFLSRVVVGVAKVLGRA